MTRTDRKKLERLLNLPPVPPALRARLHANLDRSADPHGRRRGWLVAGLGVCLAATVLVPAALLYRSLSPPAYVRAAVEDMRKDRPLRGALDGGSGRWLAAHGIRRPPAEVRVELSKDCLLGKFPSKHLRLISGTIGNVNLFIHSGPEAAGSERLGQGEWEGQPWLLLQPRPGLMVAVLFERPSARPQVLRLVETMFAAAPDRA